MDVSAKFHCPAALLRGKEPWFTLDGMIVGPQANAEYWGREKSLSPAGSLILIPQLSSP